MNALTISLTGDNFLVSPSSLSPDMQRTRPYPNAFGYIYKRNKHSVKHKLNSVSLVSILFALRSPIAVFFFVAGIIFSAFNRMFRGRASPHIGDEILERIEPPLAYLNSPASVISKTGIVGIIAASLHCSPNFIFRCVAHSMRKFNGISIAAARIGFSVPKVRASDFFISPAIAEAIPILTTGIRNNGISTEFQTSDVLETFVVWKRMCNHLRRFSMCVHIGFSGLAEVITLSGRAYTFTI